MRKQTLKKVFFILLVALASIFFGVSHKTYASNPSTLNFQGKVVNSDGTNVANGTYSFVFRIYDSANPSIGSSCSTDSHCKWEETQSSVSVTNGVFQVELGSVCGLTSGSCNNTSGGPISWATTNTLYLTMKFNGETTGTCNSVSSNGFMCPAIHLTSVPFAFNADQLGGLSASGFIQNNSGAAQTSSNFHISGTGVADTQLQSPLFDTATSAGALGIGTTNAGTITLGNVTNSSFLFKTKQVASAFQVQNASSYEILTVDTSATEANNLVRLGRPSTINGRLVFDNSSNTNTLTIVSGATSTAYTIILPMAAATANNYCLVMSNTGTGATSWVACGSGATRTVTLAPEYPGAVMTPNNNTANTHTGTMTSDFCSGSSLLNIAPTPNPCGSTDQHSYYAWTANATNDFDIFVQWQVPSDFASFSSITFNGWTSSTSDAAKITVYKNGVATACGTAGTVSTSGTWSTANPATGSCTISANDTLTFDIDLKVGVSSEYARAGEIVIVYNRS